MGVSSWSARLAQPLQLRKLLKNTAPPAKLLAAAPPARLSKAILHAMPTDPSNEMQEMPTALMALAIERARDAEGHGDVPIGAVIARDGEVLAAAGNERELRGDPTAHAEILAIRAAAEALGGWRLAGTTIYVTLEPCAMCAGAIVLARIPEVIFGAPDPKAGAAGSVLDVLNEPAFNHHPRVTGHVMEAECAALLRDFFAARR
jgi:tRNA(adenine34) deaminase